MSSRTDQSKAVAKYKEFHRYNPKRITELGNLKIPGRMRKLGASKWITYRSAKVDPATLEKPEHAVDYVHETGAGVSVYAADGKANTDVPEKFCATKALVKLGKLLGIGLQNGQEIEGTLPLPDLAATPDGKCLIVHDGKRVILAIWGGGLGVHPRGIDG